MLYIYTRIGISKLNNWVHLIPISIVLILFRIAAVVVVVVVVVVVAIILIVIIIQLLLTIVLLSCPLELTCALLQLR